MARQKRTRLYVIRMRMEQRPAGPPPHDDRFRAPDGTTTNSLKHAKQFETGAAALGFARERNIVLDQVTRYISAVYIRQEDRNDK